MCLCKNWSAQEGRGPQHSTVRRSLILVLLFIADVGYPSEVTIAVCLDTQCFLAAVQRKRHEPQLSCIKIRLHTPTHRERETDRERERERE